MNSLPTDILNIIINYKNELEHKEKFEKTLKLIKNCAYEISNSESERSYYDEDDLEQSILYQYDYETRELMYWRVDMNTQLEWWIVIEY